MDDDTLTREAFYRARGGDVPKSKPKPIPQRPPTTGGSFLPIGSPRSKPDESPPGTSPPPASSSTGRRSRSSRTQRVSGAAASTNEATSPDPALETVRAPLRPTKPVTERPLEGPRPIPYCGEPGCDRLADWRRQGRPFCGDHAADIVLRYSYGATLVPVEA